jgi:hypothetical protein
MLVNSNASTNKTCSNAVTFGDVTTSAISFSLSVYMTKLIVMVIAVSLTCSKQSKHGEAENTTNNPLTAAGGVAGLAAPGTLPCLLLPVFMSSPFFLL